MNIHRVLGALLPISGFCLVGFAAAPAYAQAAPSGIPCSALTQAVIANTGQVFSDAASKVTGNVQAATTIVHNGGSISGTQTPNTPAHLPVVPPPAGATNLGTFILGSGQTRTLTAGNYVASTFTLNSNSTLLTSGGPVFIWVTGALTLSGAENVGGQANDLQFLVTDAQDVNVNSSGGELIGSVYAPEARVNVNRSVVGTVVGSTVTLNSNASVQFDAGSECPTAKVTKVVAGDFTACALLADGTVDCWGEDDTEGDLGTGTTGRESCTTNSSFCRTTPTPVVNLSGAVDVSSDCAVLANGTVECWGGDGAGDLGDGAFDTPSPVPVPVLGLTTAFAVASSNNEAFSCALLAGGTAACWGENFNGELGNGSSGANSDVPVAVSGLTGATAIAAGASDACVILSNGSVECWGGGILGNGGTTGSTVPVPIPGLSNVISIAIGSDQICAVEAGGQVFCWGDNPFGEVGDGTQTTRLVPTPIGITNAVSVGAGQSTSCAVLANGTAECWGLNGGQLGIGTTTGPFACGGINPCSLVPVPVVNVTDAVQVSVGDVSSCVLTAAKGVQCWGDDSFGELGDGVNSSSVPFNSFFDFTAVNAIF